MSGYLLKGGIIVNENSQFQADVLIKGERIEKIGANLEDPSALEIDVTGKFILPGCIDDQVHFREPGLTHKGNIFSESRAAVAGGITSFMEMPNTVPNTLTQDLLEEKYSIAAENSLANYSFYMGASNDNLEEVLKTNASSVCGIKVFMGSSTGNMLVDNEQTLTNLFSNCEMLIATHCEDEATIRKNLEDYKGKYGDNIPVSAHPLIRSAEACYLSSSFAVNLAKKYDTRLHILHISTAKEVELFRNDIPLKEKRITAEACVHHLWFSDNDYEEKGNFIKWNPAVKTSGDREAIWKAVNDGRIDVIATDHAPHTLDEKSKSYLSAPSGGPLVQHALLAMYEKSKEGKISLENVVHKMAHAPAELFGVVDRGFLREGYFADIVVLDPNTETEVTKAHLLYKCQWSPFEGHTFNSRITSTFVNGHLAYNEGKIIEKNPGRRLSFKR